MWAKTMTSKNPDNASGATRRHFLRASSAFAVALAATAGATANLVTGAVARARELMGVGPALRSPTTADPLTFGAKPVVLTEGTNISAAASADGKQVVFDVMGLIWVMPLAGGEARQLTSYLMDSARPHWSPDGKLIAFQAFRDGAYHIWVVKPDGSGLRQLTSGVFDDREPRFSPDGNSIAFASDRAGGKYGLYVMTLDGSSVRPVGAPASDEAEPAWSPDGKSLAFTAKGGVGVRNLDGSLKLAPAVEGAQGASWTPDGKLTYNLIQGPRVTIHVDGRAVTDAAEDVFPFGITWISATEFLYTADGHIKRRSLAGGPAKIAPFKTRLTVTPPTGYARTRRSFEPAGPRPVKGICEPALSPDGRQVAFCALGQLWILTMDSAAPRPLTDDLSAKRAPAWSPDGRSLAYVCDRSGAENLIIRDLATNAERQLTSTNDGVQWPAWSPDGRQIAFLNRLGEIYAAAVADGAIRKVAAEPQDVGRPSWSPDGATLIASAKKVFSGRFREAINVLLTVDVASGKATYNFVEPSDLTLHIDGRDRNGPAWSPDGKWLAFAMAGFLWLLPVDAKGRATGKPVQLTDELSETPSWNAASSHILYQSGVSLRRIAVTGGAPETISLSLTWRLPTPKPGVTVVHAGRLWDGRSASLASDMDVVIEGARIVSVEKHRSRDGVTWVDASRLTVMPGLIDMHVHNTNDGLRGALNFLSFGITTVRGLGIDAYRHCHAIENNQVGAAPFPRYFGTGEIIDGTRISDSCRSVRNRAQLEMELGRAKTFDYDLIKTYVRMAPELQKRAIEYAHSIGVPATSHYLFPAVAFGADGKEHIYGTDRLGYNRGVTLAGKTYADVVDVQAASGAARTPTLFGLTLMPEHSYLLDDPRITTVMPKWIYKTTVLPALKGELVDRFASRSAVMVNQVATVRAMLAKNVTLVTGTDDPLFPAGIALHNNLWYMAKFGMKPLDIMRSATSVPGDYLGHGIGAVEPGKYADLIAIDGDPLADVGDVVKVKITMVGGKAWTVDEMVAMMVGKEGAAAST